MLPSSLRALLVALAMVFQTIAGGVSVAHAAHHESPPAVSALCDRTSDHDDGTPGQAGSHDGRHICQSCLLCAGPPTISISSRADIVFAPRSFALIGFDHAETRRVVAHFAQASRARAPPRA